MSHGRVGLLCAVVLLAGFVGGAAMSAPAAKAPAGDVKAAKVKLARAIVQQMTTRLKNNQVIDLEDMELWLQHLLDAELAVAAGQQARLAAYQANVAQTAELAKIMKSYSETGEGLQSNALAAEFYHLEAEARLAEAMAQ